MNDNYDRVKEETFKMLETDEIAALGKFVARLAGYNGSDILRVCQSALTDANFHQLTLQLELLRVTEFGI